MSIKQTSKVWKHPNLHNHTDKFVLLALAEFANDEGLCWPSMPTIAASCSMSEDGVRQIIKRLESAKYLTLKRGRGRGHKSHYQLHIEQGEVIEKVAPDEVLEGEKVASKSLLVKAFCKKAFSQKPNTTPPHIDNRQILKPSLSNSDANAPQTSAKKPRVKTEFVPGSLVPLENPIHQAARRCCAVKEISTLKKQQAVEEACRDLIELGAIARDFEKFKANWWTYKFGGAYHGKAPTANDLRDHWDEVLALGETRNGKQSFEDAVRNRWSNWGNGNGLENNPSESPKPVEPSFEPPADDAGASGLQSVGAYVPALPTPQATRRKFDIYESELVGSGLGNSQRAGALSRVSVQFSPPNVARRPT